MREFNLDLLINKEVAVNCKTKKEGQEFLKYLNNKGIKWNNYVDIFSSKSIYKYLEYMEDTCFSLTTGMLQFSSISWYLKENYRILSLDDLVAIKPKNNFKEYGFEADFEGEILKQIDDIYIGYYINEADCPISCQWWNNGMCSVGTDVEKLYKIIPIKKEWYLDKDNFEAYKGKIIINKYGNIRMIQSIDENKVSTFDQNMYHDIIKVEEWRPATKEEVLSLLVKE